MYPIVVLRKVNSRIREDHLTFITVDKKHEVPFVELYNECLHAFYKEDGTNITHDVEYNDGCASQFKCTGAFSSMARRSIKTTLIFCKTSHGKCKLDGLGGIIKTLLSEVCMERNNHS